MGKKDPAAMQTASGIPKIKEIGTSFLFSEKEKQHLKKLGDRTAQIAALPVQKEKAELWRAHNDLKTSEPVVILLTRRMAGMNAYPAISCSVKIRLQESGKCICASRSIGLNS